MTQHTQQRCLVLGLGHTGLSCVRYLHERGYQVTLNDTRAAPPMLQQLTQEFPDVQVHTGSLRPELIEQSDMLVVSPGLSLQRSEIASAVHAGKDVIGDIELFAREAHNPVLAITGSNGKSTVTILVGMMCQAAGLDTAIGGNIGIPALSLLRQPEPEVYVLELSSFQLETTHSLHAHAAVILNVTADHMDRYADLQAYAAAKQRVLRGAGVMILNADDPVVLRMRQPERSCICFSLQSPQNEFDYGIRVIQDEPWFVKGDESLLPCAAMRVPGRHNLSNALAAIALAQTLAVPIQAIRQAMEQFNGLAHRTEVVAQKNDVLWINDSKATNVGATSAALGGMDKPVVLIAGGDAKGADFSTLKSIVSQHARAVILIGRDALKIEAALAGATQLVHADTLEHAVALAADIAQRGDIVLLSPACASFDMFTDFQHRGEVFRAAVKQLLGLDEVQS